MNDKPGSSKRSSTASILTLRSKKRRITHFFSDESDCSSEEAVFSQCNDEEREEENEEEMLSSDESIIGCRQSRDNNPTVRCDPLSCPLPPKHQANNNQASPEQNNPGSPDVIRDYGMYPDIPDDLLVDVPTTPSVSLLRSSAATPNLSVRETPTLRDEIVASSPTSSLSAYREPPQPEDQQPSQQGATSSCWTSEGTLKTIDFSKTQELLVPAPSDPFEAFRLLLDDDYLDMIVHETNLNAVRVLTQPGVTEKSRITNWKNLDREELMIFLGLLLHTGTIRLNRLNDYWKKHWLFNFSCFSQYMSRNRFMLILRCLHFTSEPSDEDRLAKIRPIMDHFNNTMDSIYYPGKQLSLDESMVLWRGRLVFRQFIKNKRHKYGIKLYVLAEPDGTVIKFQIYGGAGDETAGVGHTQKVVLKLLEEKLDSGHSIYMDNYYNSYNLAVKLLDRETYCTGTLGQARKGNPTELGTVILKKGENKSFFLNKFHIGKWRDKRYVLYLSTEHGDEMLEVTNKRGQVTEKPSAIVHYNNFMSGVDLQDQMLSYYPCERKTLRWYKKIFIHTLQMSLSNTFYLYNKFSGARKMNLYDYRLSILEKMLPKQTVLAKTLVVEHKLTKIENVKTREKKERNRTRTIREVVRKECKGCRGKKKRTATLFECKGCPDTPGYCTECFCEAHS